MFAFVSRMMKSFDQVLSGRVPHSIGLSGTAERDARRLALGILAIYILAGVIWILLSDRLLHAAVDDPLLLMHLQTIKGWIFVFATGGLVSMLVYRSVTALLRSQAVLRESNERYRLMVEGSEQVFFYEHDCEHRFTYLSPSIESVLGYASDQLAGQAYDVLLTGDASDGSVHERTRARLAESAGTGIYDAVVRHRDGRRRVLEIVERPVQRDGTIAGLQGFARDVTERRRTEEALRQSETHLRSLLEGIRAIVWECDAHTWEFTYISHGVEEILGYPVEMWYEDRQLWENTIHPEDRGWVIEACMAGIISCRDSTLEYRSISMDGSVVWLRDIINVVTDAAGRPERLRGVMVDITEQKRAEEKILRNERRLEAAQQIANIGDWDWDIATDSVTWSDELFRICGLEPEGRVITFAAYNELIHSDDRETANTAIERALLTREPFSFEHRFVRPDGVVRRVDCRGGVSVGPDGAPVRLSGTAHDVTEQQLAEEVLRDGEERFRQLAENIDAAFWMADLDFSRILYVSPSYEKIWGRSRDELLLNPVARQEAIHPEDRQYVLQSLEDARMRRVAIEHRIIHPDGEVRWIACRVFPVRSEQGEIYRLAGIEEDITDRKKAEAALRENESRFRALVENVSDGIAILEVDGSVRYVSPSFERITGCTAEESTGRNVFERVHPADTDMTRHEWGRLLADPAGSVSIEPRIQHSGGEWRTVELVGKNLLDDPVIRGIVVTYKDVTEHRNLEEQLRQAQKLEAVGRLAGGVAHDFNNVLMAIQGHAQLALEEMPEGHTAVRDLGEIQRNAERAANLTRQLLAFSRQQVIRPRVVDLNIIVSDMQIMLGRLIGEDLVLETALASELPRVEADPNQIEQVVMNLVVNARDAMPGGGRITIATRLAELAEERAEDFICPARAGCYVLLSISDNGMGMDRDTQARIFEPFFTTKELGKGTGLGLATVYGIVNQSGGCIRVWSEPGEGTTFDIYLPLAQADAAAVAESFNTGSAEPGRIAGDVEGGTVLLVEDEGAVRELIRRVLQREGYTVLEAADGREAVQLAAEHPGAIQLVLTDVVMPVMGGQELSRIVRLSHPESSFLFMSGYTEDEVVRRGFSQGDVAFLEKPFTPAALVERVRVAMGVGSLTANLPAGESKGDRLAATMTSDITSSRPDGTTVPLEDNCSATPASQSGLMYRHAHGWNSAAR